MKLTITTSTQRRLIYEVDYTCSVLDLKIKIHDDNLEWPIQCMKLVHDDILFVDTARIEHYNLDESSKIRLVIIAVEPSNPNTSCIDPQLEHWYINH